MSSPNHPPPENAEEREHSAWLQWTADVSNALERFSRDVAATAHELDELSLPLAQRDARAERLAALFTSEYGERGQYTAKQLRVLDRRVRDLSAMSLGYNGRMA